MHFELGYGNGTMPADLPDRNLMGVLEPNRMAAGLTGEAAVRDALAHPIGSGRIGAIVRPGETVAIVTSDITRPCPTSVMLPLLLDELYASGIRPKDITLVFARGSHRAQTDAERRFLAGERAWAEIRCTDSDPDDCVHLGVTSRGTPADFSRSVAKADRRILLGNIEYHYFAGYSGGAKALMPGCSTREAIQHNHSMMVLPGAFAGNLRGNPLREDIEEAAAVCGADFILNAVLDGSHRIVYAAAGDVTAAHRAGCRFLDRLYRIPIPGRADIVLVSQGGAPKDLNLYQTQKALDNAKHAVRKGGTIILIGCCREGFGETTFETWMQHADSPQQLIDRIRKEFRLGGHKAAAIALVLRDAEVDLVSDMDPAVVRQCFLEPFPTAQAALDRALARYGNDAKVLVMPFGGSTLPHTEI